MVESDGEGDTDKESEGRNDLDFLCENEADIEADEKPKKGREGLTEVARDLFGV